MPILLKQNTPLPGFGLTLGFTVFYASVLALIPLSALFFKTGTLGWDGFVEAGFSPRAMASYKLTFGAAFASAIVNAVFGLVVAWTLVRHDFPGRRLLDAVVDLPFAIPTAVSGIALTAIYAPNGLLGEPLARIGIKAAYSPVGVFIAMTFIGLPFVVRTLQPAIEEIEPEIEEAAAALGATRGQAFRRVLLPAIGPALLTGFAMAFARALGEYGSVAFISGNLPMKTEISALLIITKLEQYDYAGATAIATVMLLASFAILLIVNRIQAASTSSRAAAGA